MGKKQASFGKCWCKRSYSLCCQCDLNRDLGVIKDGSIRMTHVAADPQDGRKGVRNPARPTLPHMRLDF